MELTITALSLAVIFLVSVIIIIVTRKPQESDWLTKELVKKTDELSDRTNGLNKAIRDNNDFVKEYKGIYEYLHNQGINISDNTDPDMAFSMKKPLLECVKELAERVGK